MILNVVLMVGLIQLSQTVGWGERVLHVTYMKSRCDYCQMLFQEERFGAELVTAGDSSLFFDATECLVGFLLSDKIPTAQVKMLWSVNYYMPGKLLDAKNAVYVNSPNIPSPMEVNIAAFRTTVAADSAIARHGGRKLTWQQVVDLVGKKWFGGKSK